jgi:hypothetical protein
VNMQKSCWIRKDNMILALPHFRMLVRNRYNEGIGEYHLKRLLRNVQMQGAQNIEE